MSTKRMNWKARRYLLTGRTDTSVGWNVWGIQTMNGVSEVRHFITEPERRDWIRQNPYARQAVGKRNPKVKAFRQRKAAEDRDTRRRWSHLDPAVQWSVT